MLLIAGGMPDCGRYLQQSQVHLRRGPQSCRMSRPTSELARVERPDGKPSAQRRLASFGIKQYIASRSKPGTGDIR